jgi:DNA polymerase
MKHKVMGVDIETYSSVDLTKSGVYRYTESPDFAILIIGFKFDDEEEVRQIDLLSPTLHTNYDEQSELMTFRRHLYDPEVLKTAYNANFERTCLAKWSGREMPPEQWSDTMVLALELGLPRSLADVGMALGLPEDKLKDPQGKALIQFFSKPCKPTKSNGGRTRNLPEHDPDKWQLYLKYNKQDVITEHEIRSKLTVYPLAESEQELWCLDQRMNDNGVRIDVPMVEKIVNYDNQRKEELIAEAKELTGLSNPNSLAQLKPWLKEHGAPMASITKDTIAAALASDIPDNVRRVLEIRTALGKTSTAKYSTMLGAVCEDERLKGILQFYGANRSGRWAGKLVQTHNLARNSLPDLDLARALAAAGDFETMQTLFGEASFVFSELVRTAFIPSEGCRFIVSDFAAIEARVISWISGEQWRLDAFKAGKDIYCETASQMYHVPVVKHGENGELRAKGKVAELACGYQGGVGAMKQMDKEGKIPEEELQGIVDQWRLANPKVVKLWKTCENAAKTAMSEHRTVKIRCGIKFSYINGNLFIKLPGGRKLCYWGAKIGENRFGSPSIVYKGVNQTTHKWSDVETYGGKLVENIVQATARDCLAEVMRRVSAKGYKIVMHVHDEIIVDVPREDTDAPAIINNIMAMPIDWAEGLPLKGDTYETDFYKKD